MHMAIDLINLSLRQVEVTTDKTGESLDHYQLESGDVVLIDRGYNQPKTLVPFLDRGGEVVLRYSAHSMKLYDVDTAAPAGQRMIKVDWESRFKPWRGSRAASPSTCVQGTSVFRYLSMPYRCHRNRLNKPGVRLNSVPKERDEPPAIKRFI
ncbi:MAG: hypothetical protein R3E95_06235 [Thiolinea sp.]